MAEINDFITGNAEKQVQDYIKNLDTMRSMYGELAKEMSKAASAYTKEYESARNLNKEIEKAGPARRANNKAATEAEKIQRNLIKTNERIAVVYSEKNKQLVANRARLSEANKEIKRNITISTAQKGSYQAISAALSINITKWQKLSAEERNNTKEGKALLKTIQQQDRALKGLDAQIGRSQRHVGDYGRALVGVGRSLLGAFGVVGGLRAFAGILRGTAKIVFDFEKNLTRLASITGKSKDELAALSAQATELGSITAFTASQVVQLQTELAKLGFSDKEILQATKSVIDFSVATGSEVPDAAALAGAALRSFNLDASQMDRVVSVLGVSTTKSALDFRKLETALPYVASAANAVNVSIERTTALLGVLSDRGLDASTAGTSLRNIFLELEKRGLTWAQAMEQIASAQDKAATAAELFGKRGAVAGLILAQNGESADALTSSLENTGDALQKMADTQLDSVAGKLKILQSSWEGLTLSIEDGEGPLGNWTRNAITSISNLVTLTREWNQDLISGGSVLEYLFSSQKRGNEIIAETREQIRKTQQAREEAQANFERSTVIGTVAKVTTELDKLTSRQEKIELLSKTFERFNEIGISDFDDRVQGLRATLIDLNVAEFEANQELEKLKETAEVINFDALVQQQSELKKSIKNLATEGQSYNEELREYERISKRIADINNIFGSATTLNQLDQLRKTQKELRTEIQLSALAGDDFNEKLIEYNRITAQLKELDGLFKPEEIKDYTSEFKKLEQNIVNFYTKVQVYAQQRNEANAAFFVVQQENELKQRENYAKVLFSRGILTEQQYNKRVFDLRQEGLTNQLDLLEQESKSLDKNSAERIKVEAEIAKQRQAINDAATDYITAQYDEQAKKAKETQKKIEEGLKQVAVSIVEGTSGILKQAEQQRNEARQAELDRELQMATDQNAREQEILREKFENNLITEQAYNSQKANLDAKLKEKEKKIALEKFQADKRARLAEARINIAAGILKTMATSGFPAAIPLIAALGIAGAFQLALIQKEEPPKFAKGVRSSPEGLAIVGEAGREILKYPSGQMAMAESETLTHLPRGTRVYNNRETEMMIRQAEHRGDSLQLGVLVSEFRQGTKATVKAIKESRPKIITRRASIEDRTGRHHKNHRNRIRT